MTSPAELATLEKDIRKWAKTRVASNRIAHVRGVVKTAAKLAERYAPEEIARVRLAGWIHDTAKNWDEERLLAYAEQRDWDITPIEFASPMLLHGAVGYSLAAEHFNFDDPLLQEACSLHTTGAPGMSTAAKIVFIADYAEPTRRYKRAKKLRAMMFDDLDAALLKTVDSVIRYLIKRQRMIDPRAVDLRNDLIVAGVTTKR